MTHDLKSIDFEILKYISDNKEVNIEDLLNKFPEAKFSTEYRLSLLWKQQYDMNIPVENTSFIDSLKKEVEDLYGVPRFKDLNIFYVTELGKKALQDHYRFRKEERLEIFLKRVPLEAMRSILCPIFVAFITTLLTAKFLR